MKSTSARGASLAILLASLASSAWCQDAGPSLLPMPPLPAVGANFPVSRAAATDALWGAAEPSPAPQVGNLPSPDQSIMGPEYLDSMKGGYSGSCMGSPCGGSACCGGHYVYANALVMTQVRPGSFVPTVDSATGDMRINFCSQNFGNIWVGGFEIGAGWCLGGGCGCGGCGSTCCCKALELVYWGLFPATKTVRAVDNTNSTIDFGDLDYNGASANVPFTNSELQQVRYSYNFNSVEANLVGNSLCGGPFGCGMCGFCCGRSGSPWGFGYLAGFRYINFSERFLFSGDPTGFAINGDPQELNYVNALNNNLFGFQLGSGLSYCLGSRLTAYGIGRMGIYDNHVTQLQQVYGTAGNAVINNGPFVGQEFLVRSSRDALAVSGQLDLGGRWAISNNWSANFGYRVLGLAGVATVDTNIVKNQFHNVDGIATMNRNGSFLIHGAFFGATYCF